jgi:putative transcriptional regulator
MSGSGRKILEGLDETLRFVRGEDTGARVWQVHVVDAAAVRQKTGLSQEEFARRFGISLATLRNWEQGVRAPEGPARVLLMVIDQAPQAVERAIEAFRPKRVGAETVRPNKQRRVSAKSAAVTRPVRRKRP